MSNQHRIPIIKTRVFHDRLIFMMENPTPKKMVLILKGALKSLIVMGIVERVATSCPPTKLTTTFVHDVDNVCILEAQLFYGANQELPRRIIGDNRWFPAHAESLIKIMKSIWFGVAFSAFVNLFNFIYMGIQRLELWKSQMYCNEGLIIWGPYHGMIWYIHKNKWIDKKSTKPRVKDYQYQMENHIT